MGVKSSVKRKHEKVSKKKSVKKVKKSKVIKKDLSKESSKNKDVTNNIMKDIKAKIIKEGEKQKLDEKNPAEKNSLVTSKPEADLKKHLIEKHPSGKEKPIKEKPIKSGKFDMASIASEIKNELISKQRKPVAETLGKEKLKPKLKGVKEYVFTGVTGFDELLEKGIPKGNAMIIAGGAGSGKTIFCSQTMINKAEEGKKCLIMTLEEKEEKLIQHMEDFGWPADELIKKGNLKIMRINPFDITRNVDALLAKQKGELLIDIEPVILPDDFKKPDFVVIDSLTAISSAFTGKDDSYRIYIEQLFRFLEQTEATSFLITETEQIPKIFSQTGVEEFLADGVIVIYNIKHENVRENAIEILKLRGAAHRKKIVAMQITGGGIVVYPEQEVFSEME